MSEDRKQLLHHCQLDLLNAYFQWEQDLTWQHKKRFQELIKEFQRLEKDITVT